VPNDPSGSLYLSRLADFTANKPYPVGSPAGYRRGRHRHTSDSAGAQKQQYAGPSSQYLADRAQQYDRALQASMNAASIRRRTSSSRELPPRLHLKESDMDILPEDRAEDGGVDSQLGESYVGDVRTRNGMLIDRGKPFVDQSQEEVDDPEAELLANGGLVGLLAQIYEQQRQVI